MQRATVGLVGLAAVILLIGIASLIMRAVTRERPATAQPELVANMTVANMADSSGEPLADLGVTASSANSAAPQRR